MPMPPQGYHIVRQHLRRNPRPKAKKLGGWTIAALIAGVWLWSQVFGIGEASPHSPAPHPSISTPAGR